MTRMALHVNSKGKPLKINTVTIIIIIIIIIIIVLSW